MNKAFDRIKRAWEENPLQVIVVMSFAAVAASKLIDATNSSRNSQAWKREVDRRIMMNK